MDPGREVKDLSVLSLHHWGENPKGTWTMRVRSVNPNAKNSGRSIDFTTFKAFLITKSNFVI